MPNTLPLTKNEGLTMLNLLQSELKLSKIHKIIDEIDQVDQVTSSLHRQMVQEILLRQSWI